MTICDRVRGNWSFVNAINNEIRRKFNRRYNHISSKYNTTLKRHIEDGMCGLPVLSKHVTIRAVHR